LEEWRSVRSRKHESDKHSPLRLILWTALLGFFFGFTNLSDLPEDLLRTSRNKLHMQQASGDIVLIAIDDASLKDVGRWPWPRRYYGQLIDKASAAGVNRIFFDIIVGTKSDPVDDQLFADALKRSGRVTLPSRTREGPGDATFRKMPPLDLFAQHTDVATITLPYNYQNAVWHIPYTTEAADGGTGSFSAKLAQVQGKPGEFFTVDYSIDPSSIPVVAARDLLSGKFDRHALQGKDIVIGATSETLNDTYFVPGTGKLGGPIVQILGAETLKAGRPRDFGWSPVFVLALIIAACALPLRRPGHQNLVLGGAVASLLVLPAFLEANQIYFDIIPGLLTLMSVQAVLAWRRWQSGGLVNATSGLPNLNALLANRDGRSQALIAARILNYAEIIATLPADGERKLIEQIVARLSVGAPQRTLYQGDGGIFAWFEESRLPFANHIEALYALFRNPARVGGAQLDLTISFGVEIGSNRSLANRLASALVAAEEAAHDGLKWKYHDPETLQDASWKLSMLSQLDAAVDKGEIWVAYQPKLDLKTRDVIGAEALARWTHPEKGPIAATEFIAAAEQHDRIGKLTDFVLEQSIRAAAELNKKRPGFGIAVNLSAKLLTDQGLTLRLAAMLARHGLKSEYLTLELTETAALTDTGAAIEMLGSLKEIGVGISIDDYGTGLSTLDYLKKIPASEIKIDQSFVKGLLDNRSDRLMVQSTIGLAHSLGRKVVAEGVERTETLEALIEMECDIAQGFIVGRPMSLESLLKRITGARKSHAA
jgi:EAL domain-containing protein (putative c-di-GMP-specific phosphodiesterase class I)/CHASE2 domain-containing sensor protein